MLKSVGRNDKLFALEARFIILNPSALCCVSSLKTAYDFWYLPNKFLNVHPIFSEFSKCQPERFVRVEGQDSGRRTKSVTGCKVRFRDLQHISTTDEYLNMWIHQSFLRSKKVETRDGGHLFDQGIQGSLASWNKLPKAPDQEVILLKKARGEIHTQGKLRVSLTMKDHYSNDFQRRKRSGATSTITSQTARSWSPPTRITRTIMRRSWALWRSSSTRGPVRRRETVSDLGEGTSYLTQSPCPTVHVQTWFLSCTYSELGMPIGLRSQIEDGYLGDWYKSCYHTLHKNFGRDYKSNYNAAWRFSITLIFSTNARCTNHTWWKWQQWVIWSYLELTSFRLSYHYFVWVRKV